MKPNWVFVLFTMAFLSLCGASRGQVVRDYDKAFDFRAVKKFAWLEQEKLPILRIAPWEAHTDIELDQLVRTWVDEELRKKKFQRVSPLEADILVTYLLVGELDLESQSFDAARVANTPYGHWRPFYNTVVDTVLLRTGTLTLDLVDRAANRLVWRGSASGSITQEKQAEEKIEKAIKKILSKFPPKQG